MGFLIFSAHFPLHVQAEKRKLLNIFLKHFLITYRNWVPVNMGQSPEDASHVSFVEYSQQVDDKVIGCYFGHPSEIILVLIEGVAQITALLSDSKLELLVDSFEL